jgi:hypothetical protein
MNNWETLNMNDGWRAIDLRRPNKEMRPANAPASGRGEADGFAASSSPGGRDD